MQCRGSRVDGVTDHKKKSAEKVGEGGLAAAYANVTPPASHRVMGGGWTYSN